MGQVTIIHRVSPPWNPLTTELKRVFDVLFSSSYATGGDTMAAGEIAKLYQGINGQTPGPYQHIKFESELAKLCAVGTLTSTGVNVTAGDTVTIGTTTYTFRAAPTLANEVTIGASAAASLTNLRNALVQDTAAGYFAGLDGGGNRCVRNTEVRVVSVGATTLVVQARIGGAGGNISPVGLPATNYGNSIATTKVAVTLSWGAATLAGGADTGIAVSFDVVTQKFSLWNGSAQIANATDEHLLQARCSLTWMLDTETTIGYGL